MNSLFKAILDHINLSSEDIKLLQSHCSTKTFNKHDIFIFQGELCTKMAYLNEGSFRCYYTTDEGHEANTEFIIDHGFVTDYISYSKKAASKVTIQALEKSNVTVINLSSIKANRLLLQKLRRMGNYYIQHNCLPVLMDYQILLSERPDQRYRLLSKNYPHYIQRISQKHLASYLHLRPETLSRIRKRFLDLDQLLSERE